MNGKDFETFPFFHAEKEKLMIWTIVTHLLCFIAGGTVGVFTMCMMIAAKDADQRMESRYKGGSENEE